MRIPTLRKKPIAAPTLADRAEEASLDGVNALCVFEAAAFRLDEAAGTLAGLALEAYEEATLEADRSRAEANAVTLAAQNKVNEILSTSAEKETELYALAARLEDEAFEDRQRAANIRSLVSVE